jgi:hypothetical protein
MKKIQVMAETTTHFKGKMMCFESVYDGKDGM